MKHVLDCSTAFKWVVAETDTPKAVRLRDDFRNGALELLAPDLFPTEIANALLVAERKGRIVTGDGAVFLADILRTLPVLSSTASKHTSRRCRSSRTIPAAMPG